VEGAHRTRRSFLSFLFNPFLSSDPDRLTDLQSTLQTARHISTLLNKTDIFSNVAVKVDQARDPSADSNDVDLVFTTRERGRFYLNSSTEVGNNEGNAVRPMYILNPINIY
jgi:outer membrane protein insertion porin family